MNNSHNYADFVGMSLHSDEEFEPYGYQLELQTASTPQESTVDNRIEHMLFSHHKYYIYCE